jgi:DNA-directed RNA polymerase specialized sigma24 family protein
LQSAYLELMARVRTQKALPATGWENALRRLARRRAIDRLRSLEYRIFRQFTGGVSEEGASGEDLPLQAEDMPGKMPPPVADLTAAERRARQGSLLSDVLEEFCRWCESEPARSAIREAYERSLRGQKPAEIAQEMTLSTAQVHSLLHRAREWVYDRVKKHDVNRSVFLTLHRRKSEPRVAESRPVPVKGRPLPGVGEKTPKLGAKTPSEARDAANERADLPLPSFATLADVVQWVIDELGAMCPTPDRLRAFESQPNAPELRDVRYHVTVAQCKLCQAELGQS